MRIMLVIAVSGFLTGCGAISSVNRMDENLEAVRPAIEEIPDLNERIEEIAVRTEAIEEMTLTLEGVHSDLGQLTEVVNGLERLEQQIDFTNKDLELLTQLRGEINDLAEQLEKLDSLDEGISLINSMLRDVKDEMDVLSDNVKVVNGKIDRLDSIDNHLVGVDESVRKLHALVLMAAIAIPLLALLIIFMIYNQLLTRSLVNRLNKMQDDADSSSR